MRFVHQTSEGPGPGQYSSESTVKIKDENRENAGFKSKAQRSQQLSTSNEKVPGVGQYEIDQYKSISNPGCQGGAPNNFTLLSKTAQTHLRQVPIREQPRIPEHITYSKFPRNLTLFSERSCWPWHVREEKSEPLRAAQELPSEGAFLGKGPAVLK